MKKKLSLLISIAMLCLLFVPAFAAPAANTAVWAGSTATYAAADVQNGMEIKLTATLSINPDSFDFFEACNLTLKYDTSAWKLISAVTPDSGYQALPDDMTHGHNVVVANFGEELPTSEGYSCTLNVTMEVLDAAKLIAAGGAEIEIGLWKNDFAISKDGKLHDYFDISAGNGEIAMNLNFSPMKITVTSGSTNEKYTVRYNTNGGAAIADASVTKGESLNLPTPVRSGYTFSGWHSDAGLTTAVTSPYTPTADVTLYAKWTENAADTYTITYNTNGGSAIADASVKAGNAITLPTPTRSGYTFEGWYSDSALTSKVTSPYTPTKSITLYAKWTENAADTYIITYNTNGGNNLANSTVKAGSSVTLPTPTRSGYNFAGWYTDSGLKDKVASPYTPTADVTLYAKWTAASSSSNVPKTGIESSIPALGGTLGGLVLCAGAVMFSQRRKKDED